MEGIRKSRARSTQVEKEPDEEFTESVDTTEDKILNEGFVIFVRAIKTLLLEKHGIDVPREFIVNIVKLAAIDPTNKFLIKQQMVVSEIERLRKIVIERIVGMTEISRKVILMQLHYREKYMTREDVINTYREALDGKIIPLMDELKGSVPRHLRHYDLYYAKLIGVTIYFANTGPDTEISVVEETSEAVKSVFNKEDISLLSAMTMKDRESELMHIISISIGLRLFKKEQNPDGYGEFIEDLARILPRKIRDGLKQLHTMSAMNTERLVKYTTALEPYFLLHYSVKAGRREMNLEMVKARQALCMVHQLLIYVRELLSDLTKEEILSQDNVAHHKSILKDLHKEKGRKSAPPNSIVYPKYMELCESWQNLVDSNIAVNAVLKLTMELMQFSEKHLVEIDDLMEVLLSNQQNRVPTEQEFFEFPTIRVPVDKYALAKRVDYRSDIDPLNTNFSGFCIYSLVRGAGMLMIANPNLGIFTWRSMNFLLSSIKAATEFPRDPTSYVKRAIAIARRWPELIILLNIEAEVYDAANVTEADKSRKYTGVLVSKCSGTQSEVHPIPSNIVQSYTWNEWELRRRGIILSKIHKCRTHGTQTHWQALKKTAQCQTYGKKSQDVQTMSNVYTLVPKTQYYFAGLRGYHCGMPPHIVELTSETPEDLVCKCETKKEEIEDLLVQGKRKLRRSIGI